jgi:putative ABC transport system substrate-binding protein
LVESLARPDGNVTGITILSRDLSAKRLELFKEAIPKISRVAVLYAPASAGAAREVKEVLPAVAQSLGVTIRSWVIRAPEDFEKVFAELNKQRPDGLYLTPDVLLRVNQKRTIGFALESRLPSMYSNREAVDVGGLMYYGADAPDNYRRIALYVDRILREPSRPISPWSNRRSSS